MSDEELDLGSEVKRQEIVNTPTTRARVRMSIFSVEYRSAAFEVELGITGAEGFEKLGVQGWLVRGDRLETFLGLAPDDATSRQSVVREIGRELVRTLNNNETLKQTLIDSGELVIAKSIQEAVAEMMGANANLSEAQRNRLRRVAGT